MISIDNRDPRPLYEQVVDGFRNLIVAGVLSPDEKLPSVRSLASQLAINPNTIQRAYRELEAMGYTYSAAGKGSFVAAGEAAVNSRRQELLVQFHSTAAELESLGFSRTELAERLLAEPTNAASGHGGPAGEAVDAGEGSSAPSVEGNGANND